MRRMGPRFAAQRPLARAGDPTLVRQRICRLALAGCSPLAAGEGKRRVRRGRCGATLPDNTTCASRLVRVVEVDARREGLCLTALTSSSRAESGRHRLPAVAALMTWSLLPESIWLDSGMAQLPEAIIA
jgi:hypothetical protein